ncbi:MAG TPA: LapA family protein [Candidatus Polarisedimenticolia bacterium]|nr:LapA family protein [Candidatus Polarisedimenticolia bacterium]
MWILKNLAWLVIMVAVVGFAILNVNGRASEIHFPGVTYVNLPLTIVLFASFALGMFLAFVLTLFHHLKGRATLGRLTRENESLRQELRALRNLPLEDMKLPSQEAREA